MTEFFNRTLENLRQGPLGPAVRWIEAHPRLSAWFVLALGMDILLVLEARDVGLLPGQWAALLIATTLVAGACIWIISWEDEPQEEEDEAAAQQAAAQQAAAQQAAAQQAATAQSSMSETPTPEAAPKKRARKPKAVKS